MKAFWFLSIAMVGALGLPQEVPGQVIERLGRAATQAAESEAHRQVRTAVREAIRCAVGDQVCQRKARQEGREVILVDESGEPLGSRLPDASWTLSFSGEERDGDRGWIIEDGILHALHLVIRSEASLYLFVHDAHIARHAAPGALLVFAGGDECRFPYEGSAPHHFIVRFQRADGNWLGGSFDGRMRCALHRSPVRVTGTFLVPR